LMFFQLNKVSANNIPLYLGSTKTIPLQHH
jgi:hypothetical protein